MPPYLAFALVAFALISIFNVGVKNFPNKLCLLFWVNLLAYVGFVDIFFFESEVRHHDMLFVSAIDDEKVWLAFTKMIFGYSIADIPLYALSAVLFVASMIVMQKLLDAYDLSVVAPLSQISIVTVTLGYVALGVTPKVMEIVGIAIVCLGAAISALPSGAGGLFSSLRAEVRGIPRSLWKLIAIQALLTTAAAMVNFLGTKDTAQTERMLADLKHATRLRVALVDPFYFNLGAQLFSLLAFLAYLLSRREHRQSLARTVRSKTVYLLLVAVAFLGANGAYQRAFALAKDPTILMALDKLTVVMILAGAVMFLGERLTVQKVVGSALIVVGGVFAVWA